MPRALPKLLMEMDPERAKCAMAPTLKMKNLDGGTLKRAAEGRAGAAA